jgi:uncharacterized protein YceK
MGVTMLSRVCLPIIIMATLSGCAPIIREAHTLANPDEAFYNQLVVRPIPFDPENDDLS